MKAIDQDYGINSPIKYTIVDGSNGWNEYFELVLDGESVKVVNKKILDRESLEESVLFLTIEAIETDKCPADGCLKTPTNCTMLIEDMNDNPPKFDFTHYTASVRESVILDEIIPFKTENGDVEIRVTDADTDATHNQASISFADDDADYSQYFTITPFSIVSEGSINIKSNVSENIALDAEQHDSVEFSLQAVDKDTDTFKGLASFKINIIDVNDHAPEFDQNSYAKTIKEDLSDIKDDGYKLATVSATDGDKSDNLGTPSIRYSLINDLGGGIKIDSKTGEVTVNPDKNPFDADTEDGGLVVIEIEAKDCGEEDCEPKFLTDITTLTVTVENVNDNFPESDVECEKTISNDVTLDDNVVLELQSSDLDGDTVKYYLMPNNYNNFPFSVEEESGNIILDTSKVEEVEQVFSFRILLADDQGPNRGSIINCDITVLDVNDKAPEFSFPVRDARYWIDENFMIGVPLRLHNGIPLQLEASDLDVNECFHKLGYSFEPKDDTNQEYKDYFSLDDVSGQFELKQNLSTLDLEMDAGKKSLVSLTVSVRDEYKCTSQDSNIMKTRLVDSRDLLLKVYKNFEPDFTEKSEKVDFDETLPGADSETWPSQELRNAIDHNNEEPPEQPWTEENIYYYLINGTADYRQHFAVDKDTNTLRVIAPLDRDCEHNATAGCQPYYDLSIVSTNNQVSAPAYYHEDSVLSVRVYVSDLNDNVPTFAGIESFYVYSTQEDECKDCRIIAEDKDTGKVFLSLSSSQKSHFQRLTKFLTLP